MFEETLAFMDRAQIESEKYRSLLAEVFSYTFVEHSMSSPELYSYSSHSDLYAASCVSSCAFHFTQPGLRLRRLLRLTNGEADEIAICYDVILNRLDFGAIYQCTHCGSRYLAHVSCSICNCMLCGTCENVLPQYRAYFHTPRDCVCSQ